MATRVCAWVVRPATGRDGPPPEYCGRRCEFTMERLEDGTTRRRYSAFCAEHARRAATDPCDDDEEGGGV